MEKKKKYAVIIAICVFVMLLVGCSNLSNSKEKSECIVSKDEVLSWYEFTDITLDNYKDFFDINDSSLKMIDSFGNSQYFSVERPVIVPKDGVLLCNNDMTFYVHINMLIVESKSEYIVLEDLEQKECVEKSLGACIRFSACSRNTCRL